MTIVINGTGSIDGVSPIAFSANAGSPQNLASGAWAPVPMQGELFDHGNIYNPNAGWVPPASRVVLLTAALSGTLAVGKRLGVAIFKNGVVLKQGTLITSSANVFHQVIVTALDIPNGTDVYTVWGFQDTGAPITIPVSTEANFFQGVRL